MTEYKVWAFARSAAPNLPALEDQLADVMREADRRGYIIVNSCIFSLSFLCARQYRAFVILRGGQRPVELSMCWTSSVHSLSSCDIYIIPDIAVFSDILHDVSLCK